MPYPFKFSAAQIKVKRHGIHEYELCLNLENVELGEKKQMFDSNPVKNGMPN